MRVLRRCSREHLVRNRGRALAGLVGLRSRVADTSAGCCRRDTDSAGEPAEVTDDLLRASRSGIPKATSVTPICGQCASESGSGLPAEHVHLRASLPARRSPRPGRAAPPSPPARSRRESSASRPPDLAIQLKFRSVPAAPRITGTRGWRGLRPRPGAAEPDVLAVIAGLVLGPQRLHRLQVLAQHRAPPPSRAHRGRSARRCSSRTRRRAAPGRRTSDRATRWSWPARSGHARRAGRPRCPAGYGFVTAARHAQRDPGVERAHVPVVRQFLRPGPRMQASRRTGMWVCSGT